MKETDFH